MHCPMLPFHNSIALPCLPLPCPHCVQSGRVVHRLMGNATAAAEELRNATCNTFHPRFKQLLAYSACVNDYGTRHQWMGEPGAAQGLSNFQHRP